MFWAQCKMKGILHFYVIILCYFFKSAIPLNLFFKYMIFKKYIYIYICVYLPPLTYGPSIVY